MRALNEKRESFSWKSLLRHSTSAIALTSALVLAGSSAALAQGPGQKTYSSPEEASQALFAAAQKNDQAALLEVLGKDGKAIIESGVFNTPSTTFEKAQAAGAAAAGPGTAEHRNGRARHSIRRGRRSRDSPRNGDYR